VSTRGKPSAGETGGTLIPMMVHAAFSRLPQLPHSVALAAVLTAALRPLLAEDVRAALLGRVVEIEVRDAGIRARIRLTDLAFVPVVSRQPFALAIRAEARDFWLLATRQEDPDTLFFGRRLLMEGDTELGLTVKNALDALDWDVIAQNPLLRPWLAAGRRIAELRAGR
jgi:predicted lipid carrier protein YhbT